MYPAIKGGSADKLGFLAHQRYWLCARGCSDELKFEGYRNYPEFPGVDWVVYAVTGTQYTSDDFTPAASTSRQAIKQLAYHGTNPHGIAATLKMGRLSNSKNRALGHRFLDGFEGL